MLYEEDEFVQAVASRVFPQIVESDDKKDVVRKLHNKDEGWEIRRPAAEAFAKIATAEDKEDMTKMLFDKDEYIREIAGKTFVEIFENHEIEGFLDFLSDRAQGYSKKEKKYFFALSILDRILYCPYSSTIERIRLKKQSRAEISYSDYPYYSSEFQKREGEILKKELYNLDCGPEKWREYEDLIIRIFQYLFVPPLKSPIIQKYTLDRLERRDALFPNIGKDPFWEHIRDKHDSELVLLECKNFCEKIGKEEIIKTADYLEEKSIGRFGLIASRHPPSNSAIKKRNKVYVKCKKLLLLVDDKLLNQMMDRKIEDKNPVEILQELRFEVLSSL